MSYTFPRASADFDFEVVFLGAVVPAVAVVDRVAAVDRVWRAEDRVAMGIVVFFFLESAGQVRRATKKAGAS